MCHAGGFMSVGVRKKSGNMSDRNCRKSLINQRVDFTAPLESCSMILTQNPTGNVAMVLVKLFGLLNMDSYLNTGPTLPKS